MLNIHVLYLIVSSMEVGTKGLNYCLICAWHMKDNWKIHIEWFKQEQMLNHRFLITENVLSNTS